MCYATIALHWLSAHSAFSNTRLEPLAKEEVVWHSDGAVREEAPGGTGDLPPVRHPKPSAHAPCVHAVPGLPQICELFFVFVYFVFVYLLHVLLMLG